MAGIKGEEAREADQAGACVCVCRGKGGGDERVSLSIIKMRGKSDGMEWRVVSGVAGWLKKLFSVLQATTSTTPCSTHHMSCVSFHMLLCVFYYSHSFASLLSSRHQYRPYHAPSPLSPLSLTAIDKNRIHTQTHTHTHTNHFLLSSTTPPIKQINKMQSTFKLHPLPEAALKALRAAASTEGCPEGMAIVGGLTEVSLCVCVCMCGMLMCGAEQCKGKVQRVMEISGRRRSVYFCTTWTYSRHTTHA